MTYFQEIEQYLQNPTTYSIQKDPYEIKVWELLVDYSKEIPKFGLVGIPFDTTSIFNRGSWLAPSTIRKILYLNRSYEPNLGIDIQSQTVGDFGDVKVAHTDPFKTENRVTAIAENLVSNQVIPIFMGGDHWTTFGTVRGFCNAFKRKKAEPRIGLITFDAHTDLRLAHHGEQTSGTPFRRIIDELPGRPISANNVVEIGIGGWHNSAYYWNYAKEQGIKIITAQEVHESGIQSVVSQAINHLDEDLDAIFVSVDIDVMDSAAAPGTGSPSPGGLTNHEMLSLIYEFAQYHKVKGMDIVEIFPQKDINDITSVLGASIIQNFIAGVTTRNK